MTDLTPDQRFDLTNALVAAFPSSNDFDSMVEFKLGLGRNEITEDASMPTMSLNVVLWSEAQGPEKLQDLVIGARNMVPGNRRLQAVAADLGLDEGARNFESKVREYVEFGDVESWRATMMARERAVCRVEFGNEGQGTGFLVGPSVVITAQHVIASVADGKIDPANVKVRFDYKMNADGVTVQDGLAYDLVPGKAWLMASSPASELDYALLRVDAAPVDDPVARQPAAPKRIPLEPKATGFEANDPMFIIQHPSGSHLKFAPGAVDNPLFAANRLSHTVNTEPGSSGSPCFTSAWTVVALHVQGGSEQNYAVPFSAILKHWEETGLDPKAA